LRLALAERLALRAGGASAQVITTKIWALFQNPPDPDLAAAARFCRWRAMQASFEPDSVVPFF
jgi:hypothetical protein